MHLGELFADFYKLLQKEETTVQSVIDSFGKSGHLLAIFVLSLPFCQPVPLPGLSTPLGSSIVFLAGLYLFNRVPKLPLWLGKKKISRKSLQAFSNVIHKVLILVQKVIKPRFAGPVVSGALKMPVSITIAVSGFLLALPLPIPLTNLVPGLVIATAAIGYLMRDTLVLIVSAIIGCVMLVFFGGLLLAAVQGYRYFSP